MGNLPFRIVTHTDATGTVVEVHGRLDSQSGELLLRVVDFVNVTCGRRAIVDFRHVSQVDDQAIEIAFGELQRRAARWETPARIAHEPNRALFEASNIIERRAALS